jgi:hypothetical protein
MVRSAFFLIAIIVGSAATLADAQVRPSAGAGPVRSVSTFRARPAPNIIENGTDTVLYSIPAGVSPGPQSIAFTPDGTAYFVENVGELTRFSTTGSFTTIAVPRIYGGTVYAHGALWIGANGGLVRVDPDGTHPQFIQEPYAAFNLFLGGDGNLYWSSPSHIYKMDSHETVTTYNTGCYYQPLGSASFAWGADGKLYFECIESSIPDGSVIGIARLEPNGTQTVLALPLNSATYEQVVSLVASGGYIYYVTDTQPTGGGYLYRLSPAGVVTKLSRAGGYPDDLVADQGGNLWYESGKYPNPDAAFLTFYDTYTNQVTGPYAPNVLANVTALFVGPDDNIWLFDKSTPNDYSEFGAYVRHVQTLEPASIVVSAASPATFTMFETHFNGPWTAVSSNPAVAAVFPATSANGAFSVTEAGKGKTTIAVRDRLGNVSYEAVLAQ